MTKRLNEPETWIIIDLETEEIVDTFRLYYTAAKVHSKLKPKRRYIIQKK